MSELNTTEIEIKKGRRKDAEVIATGVTAKFTSLQDVAEVSSEAVASFLLGCLNGGIDAWSRNRWRSELEKGQELTIFSTVSQFEATLKAIADGSNVTQTTKLRAEVAKLFGTNLPANLSAQAKKSLLGFVRMPSTAATGNEKAVKWLTATMQTWLADAEWKAHLEEADLYDVANGILTELEEAKEVDFDFG